jgi:hypothetical protein
MKKATLTTSLIAASLLIAAGSYAQKGKRRGSRPHARAGQAAKRSVHLPKRTVATRGVSHQRPNRRGFVKAVAVQGRLGPQRTRGVTTIRTRAAAPAVVRHRSVSRPRAAGYVRTVHHQAAAPAVVRHRSVSRPRVAGYVRTVHHQAAAPAVVHYRAAVQPRTVVVTRPDARSVAWKRAHRRFRALDLNRDGFISRFEARRAGRSPRAFRRADHNRDGLLSPREARWI